MNGAGAQTRSPKPPGAKVVLAVLAGSCYGGVADDAVAARVTKESAVGSQTLGFLLPAAWNS